MVKKVLFVGIFHFTCHWRLYNANRPVGEARDSYCLKTAEQLRINNDNTYLLTYILHGAESLRTQHVFS